MQKKHKVRNGKGRKLPTRNAIAFAGVLVISACAICAVYFGLQVNAPAQLQAQAKYQNINLNLSDVSYAMPNAAYAALNMDSITVPSAQLRASGYEYISVSSFNSVSTNNTSTYPGTISSTVFVLNDSRMANLTLNQIVGANSGLNTSGHIISGVGHTWYSYGGGDVEIFSIDSINVLNGTGVAAQGSMPVFEALSVFGYRNVVGSVSVNGYADLNGNMSIFMAERLFAHVVKSLG